MDDKPITTDDLYGTSQDVPKPPPLNIPIEETPEITQDATSEAPKKKSGCLGTMFTIIIFFALFIGGIWLSSFLRQFFTIESPSLQETENSVLPTTTPESAVSGSWKTYDVISATTKLPFAGVTFQLPPDVLSPICDGTNCSSQGTYLPGGTRFTVAPRGAGQALADARGAAISDALGTSFTSKAVTVAGLPATEFTGVFTGRTVSGYGFSQMRGVMVELTPTTSLEVNHFSPNGIIADFAADDTLFDAILKTINVTKTP